MKPTARCGKISPRSMPMGGEITFDSYISQRQDDATSSEDDASTLTEHVSGDAFVSTEHTVYKSTWDPGTSGLRQPRRHQVIDAKRMLRRTGCSTLIMEIFAGAMILTALATSSGWPCSEPIDVLHDGLDLTKPSARKVIDARIEAEDPFCIIFPFPCGPWNSLTEFNAARHPDFRERMLIARDEHLPMLKWMAQKARERTRRGRVALLENPSTSRAYALDFLEELEGTEDGLMDAFFEYVIGDQCLLGQHDRESGMPMRGRTKWGTNAFHLKQMLSAVCEGGHEHQQIMGSNCFGPRSQQKAEWPLEMCRHILRAIIKELKLRTVQRLFAVESAREEAEDIQEHNQV